MAGNKPRRSSKKTGEGKEGEVEKCKLYAGEILLESLQEYLDMRDDHVTTLGSKSAPKNPGSAIVRQFPLIWEEQLDQAAVGGHHYIHVHLGLRILLIT